MCDTSLTTFQSLANAEKELNFLTILLIIHMQASLYFSVFVPWQILYGPKLRPFMTYVCFVYRTFAKVEVNEYIYIY